MKEGPLLLHRKTGHSFQSTLQAFNNRYPGICYRKLSLRNRRSTSSFHFHLYTVKGGGRRRGITQAGLGSRMQPRGYNTGKKDPETESSLSLAPHRRQIITH